jgi:hypothetical protein
MAAFACEFGFALDFSIPAEKLNASKLNEPARRPHRPLKTKELTRSPRHAKNGSPIAPSRAGGRT